MSPFADLESSVCDLDHMAGLAASYIEEIVGSLMPGKERAKHGVGLEEYEGQRILFCVYQLNHMTSLLRDDFYAKFEEAVPMRDLS